MGSGDPNPDPHTCIASPLPTESYPTAQCLEESKRGVETNSNEKKMDTHGVVNQESKGKGTVRARDNKM